MDYVTTNIRIPEEDYLRLKEEAAKKRKSLSAVIRDRIKTGQKSSSKSEAYRLMTELDKIARENSKYTKGFNSVKALREIRYQGKW